jgi:glycosyltransferase involved in cell wall biosynthesis
MLVTCDQPLVSIIVLCHNYGRFLGEAIDSALAQTYRHVEVLVIDDGSSDDSLAVAAHYGQRVRVIAHANMGVARAVNRAVAEARGEYFVRLDADDILDARYVRALWEALARSPDAAYAYCRPMFFGARHGPMRCLPFSAYFLVKRTNFVNASALTRKADYLAAGGYADDLGEHALEDWDLWLRMLRLERRGTYVWEPLLRWRRHGTGSRNPEDGERQRGALSFIRYRHSDLIERMNDARGRVYFAVDFVLGAIDLVVGFSRWPRAVQAFERWSWRRYLRRHARTLPR